MPDVSLCIPVYRSERFLPELFEKLLALNPRPSEILFLNDASPDLSGELISAFVRKSGGLGNARLIENTKNRGIAAAYNRLVSEAQGEWIQILDADDYFVEVDYYRRVQSELDSGNDLVVTALGSNAPILRFGMSVFGWMVPRRPPVWWPLLGSFATRSGVIYRRARLLNRPFQDPAFPGSDILHLLQLRQKGNCIYIKNAHVLYRVHSGASSSVSRCQLDQYREGLARHGGLIRVTHLLDLAARSVGQRLGRS